MYIVFPPAVFTKKLECPSRVRVAPMIILQKLVETPVYIVLDAAHRHKKIVNVILVSDT